MIEVVSVESSAYRSLAHVVVRPDAGTCVVVDPGDRDVSAVERAIRDAGAGRCDFILLTHEHFDHIGGAGRLRETTGACVVASRACAAACGDPCRNLSQYRDGTGFVLESVDWICEDWGWTIPWTGGRIDILPCPGHSPGGVAFAIAGYLFTGDTLLAEGPGPAHLPGGDRQALAASVAELRRRFSGGPVVCPGHGRRFGLPAAPGAVASEPS